MGDSDHPVTLARKAKGWRLEDLSQRCGASKALLSNIEHGYVPKMSRCFEIAEALEISPAELWPDIEEWPEPPELAAAE